MRPLVRWTIGNTTPSGYQCLDLSIKSILRFYDVEVAICYNCDLKDLPLYLHHYPLINQKDHLDCGPTPIGVSWKLYPPRLVIDRHELAIDNDIVLNEKIKEIDDFFENDCTLLLEGDSRTYGRFEKHIPPAFQINSGIYGMPPKFDFKKYVKFYSGTEWQKNALYEHDKSETFDEQGLVALALLDHPRYVIIPNIVVTNCEKRLIPGKGYHFIGLNRRRFHQPFRLYNSLNCKIHL